MSDATHKPLTPEQKEILNSIPVIGRAKFTSYPGAPVPYDYEEMRKTGLLNGRALYRPLTYLACPYTCKTAKLRRERFLLATRACKYLMESEGLNVFSPITHSHPLYELGMRGDWDFWKRVDVEYLRLSEKVVVLMLPGWLESKGVTAEIAIAKDLGIRVEYFDPKYLT